VKNNNYNQGGNFRGGSGNFQNRNNQNNMGGNMGGFQNRNFSSPVGGMGVGGYGAANPMAGFGAAPMVNQFNNFNRGGNMMGGMRGAGMPQNRAGRAGMGNMMGNMGIGGMGMGMPNMGMGAMGGNMAMMGGMGGMGAAGGFGQAAQPHFNPAFFNQAAQQGSGDGNWNPHGAKRPRPE